MRKIISTKTQRILSFIPFLNIFVILIWLHNYRIAIQNMRVFFKALFILWITAFPLVILGMLLGKILVAYANIVCVIDWLVIYLVPLFMAHRLIKFQEGLFKEDDDNSF